MMGMIIHYWPILTPLEAHRARQDAADLQYFRAESRRRAVAQHTAHYRNDLHSHIHDPWANLKKKDDGDVPA